MPPLKLAALLALSPLLLHTEEDCGCSAVYKVVGPSFTVRGRLSNWNGAPTLRIWVVGTKRMLGIRGMADKMPKNVEALLGDFDTEIWGDFVVCPLTESKPGVMQFVCVSSASNLTQTSKKDHAPKKVATK